MALPRERDYNRGLVFAARRPGGLEDIFEAFFGGGFGGRRSGPRQGADLRYQLEIDFEEAAFGTEVKLKIPRHESCPVCRGDGAAPDGIQVCNGCRGSGTIVMSTGFIRLAQTCPHCSGVGKRITKPCSECSGTGRLRTERSVKVRVPAGVNDGTRLRLSNEGEAGDRGAPAGDLYVDIGVRPHPTFRRDGADVHAPLTVTFADLVLGGTFSVSTVHGDESFELPAGTEPGAVFGLRGKGVQKLNSRTRGDHHVHVIPEVPSQLDERERALWEELRKIEHERRAARGEFPPEDDRTLLDKVKDLFTGDR
ncbi:MAG: DnaJ C-terminal domain-containing protein [Acidobacteriota bacterium]